jgi:hypothetical protein
MNRWTWVAFAALLVVLLAGYLTLTRAKEPPTGMNDGFEDFKVEEFEATDQDPTDTDATDATDVTDDAATVDVEDVYDMTDTTDAAAMPAPEDLDEDAGGAEIDTEGPTPPADTEGNTP